MRLLILGILLITIFILTSCSNENINITNLSNLTDKDEYYESVFPDDSISQINLEISEEDWEDLLINAKEEEYYSVDITINGNKVENVGFRTKGNSSLNSVVNSESDRYGFKIKFDEYVKNQTLNGLDMMVLNGCFSDPSYLREYLTYSAFDYLNGMTPFVAYTKLYINGKLFGFYLSIEAYDDSFIERYTDSSDTVLYKAVSEDCTLLSTDDGSGFDIKYGEDEGFTNLKELISILNNTSNENIENLENILDIDSVLKAIAVNTIMGNYDSYSGPKAHNYYLLYSNGMFTYIGWDYNMSIGGFPEDNGASVDVDINNPVYNVEISQRPLIEKILEIDEYYEKYIDYVDMLTIYFDDFENTVSELSISLQENIENDPTAFYSAEEFLENISKSNSDLSQLSQDKLSQNFPNNSIDQQRNLNKDNKFIDDADPQINSEVVSIVDYITQRLEYISN